MQKITRIYVSHFGTDTAWYGPTVLDLTSPDTLVAVNAIINLENTGGKTSLLSYIFSLFDPSQEVFIQHLQNKNHHFSDYFAKDGKPSFIIIEWSMPSRHPGGSDYKLIVGQVVASRNVIERSSELERVFFAFEPRNGISFEEIPALGLAMLPLETMTEFSQWLSQMGRKLPEDFYHTKVQRDWVTHLSTTRLLDIDLLVMQRQFNSQEGGMESGFLAFKDEEDLVRKIMVLTMDAERGHMVRSTVVNVVDKLKMKPRIEARLIQLARVLAAIEPLGHSAKAYALAQDKREGISRRAAGLSAALELARVKTGQQLEVCSSTIKTLQPLIEDNQKLLVNHQQASLAMQALQLCRVVERATAALNESLNAKAGAKKRLRDLEGAILLKKVRDAHLRVESEEQSYAEEMKGLQPIREKVLKQGALLRAAIGRLLDQNASKQVAAQLAEQRAAKTIEQAKDSVKSINAQIQQLNLEVATLTAAITNAEEQRNLLLDEGVLDPYDQDSSVAISRITALIGENEARLEALRTERTDYEQQANDLRDQAHQYELSAQDQEHARTSLKKELGSARNLQEDLQQDRLLCSLVDSELCDPDSPSLAGVVNEFITAMDLELLERDIHLANLARDKESILQTKLAGKSDDVDQVVRLLSTAGIVSAAAANVYVADLIPDATEARRLVMSDPARFLGVCVAKGEWDKALNVIDGSNLHLSRPVTVALSTLDAAELTQDRLVIPPEDDSAYNLAAAATALVGFEQRIEEISGKRVEFKARRDEAQRASAKLAEYQSKCGAGRIAQLECDILAHADAEKAFRAQQADCLEESKGITSKAKLLEIDIARIPNEIAGMKTWVKRLKAYASQHEQPLPARKARLLQAQELGQTAADQVVSLDLEIDEQNQHLDDARRAQIDLKGEASQLAARKDATEIYDQNHDCQAALDAGFDLPMLIKTYEADKMVFDTEESQRLGARRISLGQLRDAEATLRAEYRNEFPDLMEEEVAGLLSLDLVSERTLQVKKNDALELAHVSANSSLAIATDQKKQFYTKHKPAAPSAEILTLSDDDLNLGIGQIGEAVTQLEQNLESDQSDLNKILKEQDTGQNFLNELTKNQRLLSKAIQHAAYVEESVELTDSGEAQLSELLELNTQLSDALQLVRARAQEDFESFSNVVRSKTVQEADPGLSHELSNNTFDSTCSDLERLMGLIQERIEASQSELDGMQPDFENCVGEVHQLVEEGMSVLRKACEVIVPEGAPYVGGKSVMKMRRPVKGVSTEAGKAAIRHYMNTLIETGVIPENGADLVAAGMINLSPSREFGLQLLQMEQNAEHQYQDAGRLKKSGGQGVVIAMFLYLMMSQLRRANQAVTKRGGGCPLILDNPFAKVQTRALIDVQIMLAEAIGVQLIFFTAMKDVNILAGFERILRLRKAGTKNGRSHIELVSATFNTAVQRSGTN